jgi:2-dehydropantoate 2-reductase
VSWTFQSVAVVGSGAVGLYYGGRLAAAAADVRFLLRSDYAAVKRQGLHCESIHGGFTLPQVNGYQTPEEIGPVDLVIISWKTTANPHLKDVLPPLLHDNTQVLTLQNGLGNCETLADLVGADRVLGALCYICLNRLAPGYVNHSGGGKTSIGEFLPDRRGRSLEIVRRLLQAGIRAELDEPLEEAQWKKLVWNVPFNGLAIAEGGMTTDRLLASAELEIEIRALMAEIIAAARARGLSLSDELIDYNVNRTRPMGPYRPSSMIDYTEGREVEIGPIWEQPLHFGKQAGVAMPHLETLLQRIRQRLRDREKNV